MASTYIDAEKLKTEIERQIQNLRGIAVDNPMLAQTMRLSFERLLSFIASLQQKETAIAYLTDIYLTPANSRRAILKVLNPPRTWGPGAQILCFNEPIQEQPELSNNLIDADAVREDFINEVYRVLDADPTNDRANVHSTTP